MLNSAHSFSQAAIFQQAGKVALDNPALGHNLGGVQLAAPVKLRSDDGHTSPHYHKNQGRGFLEISTKITVILSFPPAILANSISV